MTHKISAIGGVKIKLLSLYKIKFHGLYKNQLSVLQTTESLQKGIFNDLDPVPWSLRKKKVRQKMVFSSENCSDLEWKKKGFTDQEKLSTFNLESAKALWSPEQFIRTVIDRNNFWDKKLF